MAKPADRLREITNEAADATSVTVERTEEFRFADLLDECEARLNAVVWGATLKEGDTYLISSATWDAALATLAKLRGEA